MNAQGSPSMHFEEGSGESHSSWERLILWASYLIFAGCCLFFLFHWYPYRDAAQTRDFIAPYTGARCLWTGCNPYDPQHIEKAFAAAGGLAADHPVWRWEPPVYPPSTLIELLPFSFLRYHTVRPIWYVFNALMFCAAVLTMAHFIQPRYRAWALVAGAVTLTSETVALLFNIGQPSGVAVGLAVFALWLLLKTDRRTAGVICLGLSLGLKPQLAGLIFLCLLLRRPYRSAAIKAGILAGVILLIGIAWLSLRPVSKSWRQDYHTQVELSLEPGAVNNPTLQNYGSLQFTNLQPIFSLISETPAFYNSMTYATFAVLFGLWTVGILRTREDTAALWAGIAAIACIGLLPVYHREYDCVLLIVTFPMLAFMGAQRKWLTLPALVGTIWLLMAAPRYHAHWLRHLKNHYIITAVPFPRVRIAVFQLPQPLLLVMLSCLYLIVLAGMSRQTVPEENALTPVASK
jgi:hypothetical protein